MGDIQYIWLLWKIHMLLSSLGQGTTTLGPDSAGRQKNQ